MNNTRQKVRELPISRLFPNMVTIMSICFGITSIRYSLNAQWETAVAFIIVSGFLDVVDGRLARFLKATSDFGAQLDSLADFVNFGIAPAMLLYLWILDQIQIKGLGWGIALFYIICTAVRLARFNSDLIDPFRPTWKERFFTGIPSTAGGYLVLVPLMLSFEFNIKEYISPIGIGIYAALIGIAMASRLPTFATKKIIIKKEYTSLVLVLAGLFIGSIILEPWLVLPFFGIIYLCSIPFSITSFQKLNQQK